MAMKVKTIQPTPLQQRMLVVPENFDMFLGGGRGGGKSFALALIALRHIEQYGRDARVLYIRRSYKSLADFELITLDLYKQLYGTGAKFNQTEHVWRFPDGGYFELGQLEGAADYSKYQGRSFTLLLIDEAGEWQTPADLDKLRSNLRGPKDMPLRTVMAANPGGPGHAWLSKRYVFKGAPWKPFTEDDTGREWVYAPSTYKDNSELDQTLYEQQLKASCPTDPELLKAWLGGDWAIARGAYFGQVIDEHRNAVNPWAHIPENQGQTWYTYLAHDYGSAAPSVTYVVCESPGGNGPDGVFYPRGSKILIDELATVDNDNLNKGLGWTVQRLSDSILSLANKWGIYPEGVADDAIFSNHGSDSGSIGEEFRRAGVFFRKAKKGSRLAGWEVMRRMLQDAGKPDVPGLYVSRSCSYWWETVPYLGRDTRNPEDVDTKGADHAADACRYGCLEEKPMTSIKVKWGNR